jgi:hypothetical protein
MTKKMLTSVANVYMYDDSDGTLLAFGKTLLDSSIETTLANTDVRGGYGNQLLYVYYHTAAMNITINDAQWNLDFISKTVGANKVYSTNDVYYEENITLDAGLGGSVTYTPLAVSGTTVYGWVTLPGGTVVKTTFIAKAFTNVAGGVLGDKVCVRYYRLDTAATSITINANFIPSVVHLVLEAQLNSADETTNQIGTVQIDIPKATLTGAFSIKMSADGVASTPIAARALAVEDATDASCSVASYYAKIKEIVTSANWYDNVIGIAIEGGDFALAKANTGSYVVVYAVPSVGLPFICPTTTTAMTFASSVTGAATIGANTGQILTMAGSTGGVTVIHAYITGKPTMDAYANLTVS